LKLYQVALKFHSQELYEEAAIAYDNLFASEIFKYPESLPQVETLEVYGEIEAHEGTTSLSQRNEVPIQSGGIDGTPSTLAQILYLSYKNHGQFLLDQLTSHTRQDSRSISPRNGIPDTIHFSLRRLVEALDRDDTDFELWRQVARICESLGSTRIARYCLEAVLAADRDDLDSWSELLNLDQVFAAEQLKGLLKELQDSFWESRLAALPGSQKRVAGSLKKYIDPCPYLPPQLHAKLEHRIEWQAINVETRSWASCGKSIMFQICQEGQGLVDITSGGIYCLLIPNKDTPPARETAETSKEKGSALGKTGNNSNGTLQSETFRHLNVDSRANSIPEGRISEEAATYANIIESDIHDKALPTTPSNLSGAVNYASIQPIQLEAKSMQNEDFDIKRDHVGHFLAATQPEEKSGNLEATPKLCTIISIPTRKRSSDSAGLHENLDIGRARSKRIKARGSMIEPSHSKEASTEELNHVYEDQLQVIDQADHFLFEAAGGILSKFQVECLGSFSTLKEALLPLPFSESLTKPASELDPIDIAAQDFLKLLATWVKENTAAFLHGDNPDDKPIGSIDSSVPRNPGLHLFLEHSKRGSEFGSTKPLLPDDGGLEAFALEVGQTWTYLDQLALSWIEALIAPRRKNKVDTDPESKYEAFLWPETLKRTVVRMLVTKDELIYLDMCSRLKRLDQRLLEAATCTQFEGLRDSEEDLIRTVQNIFELHLEIYGKIINPSSEADPPTRILQLDRLGRWAALAHDAICKKSSPDSSDDFLDSLDIRFLWASVVYTSLLDPGSRDYVALCFQELIRLLKNAGSPIIELANNYMMPEISVEAAKREISRMSTMDFFLDLFSSQESNPVTVIEALEPILEESLQMQGTSSVDSTNFNKPSTTVRSSSMEPYADVESKKSIGPGLKQMLQFVGRANVSIKVILWEKLGEAYEAIAYPPQVLCCTLRRIEIIMEYLGSSSFIAKATSDRHSGLLRWLRVVGDLITKALELIFNESDIFHFVDEAHLRSAMKAAAYLQRILYAQMFLEDSKRTGKVPPLKPKSEQEEFELAMNKFREMLVRTWILQYTFIKEAFEENSQTSKDSKQDLSEYLRCLHRALGLRSFCRVAKRLFPTFMKRELVQLEPHERSGIGMAQVVYDLYGLKVCSNPSDLEDHGCPPVDLEREAADEIMDLVMVQAKKTAIKDIGKSELKFVLDKMQHAIKVPKLIGAMVFNKRIITAFLKSPINPVNLYRSLQGIGGLNGSLDKRFLAVGEKGWYLLLGHLSLARFRSQKRLFPGPVDELEIANAYFRQDLELGLEKWETWYRLAQVFDAMIEEDTTWTAEKLNSKMTELISLQRNAIHCYTMATAIATRNEDASFEAADKISDLYADFASRIYASSREPFSMKAFSLQDFPKYYNGEVRGMYQGRPFRDMQLYSAWRFASVLFKRALGHKSESWM
jgi:hypothetical protein